MLFLVSSLHAESTIQEETDAIILEHKAVSALKASFVTHASSIKMRHNKRRSRMKKNIGKVDRIVRALLAILLFGFAWWFHSFILMGFAIFTAYESIASWCIIYQLLGKNSCPI